MRKLLIISSVLVVITGLIVFALTNLNSLVASNKDQILQQVEQTLGREVEIQEIGLTVWGGIGARLTQFRIADDPAFSPDDFISANDLQVNVALLPLLSQEIQVTRIILHQPRIQIIRNAQGRFNLASLAQGDQAAQESAPPDNAESPSASSSDASSAAAIPLLIALVDIEGGDVRYIDKQDGTDFRLTQLDLRANDLSLDQPVFIELAAAVLGEQQNVTIEIQVGPVGPALEDADQISQIPLKGTAALSQLDLETLQKALPQIAQQIPPGLGISGPLNLKTDFAGRVGAVNLSNIDLQATVFDANEPNIQVSGSFGPVGTEVANPLEESSVDVDVSFGPVALERLQQFGPLAGQLPPDLSIEGPLSVTAHASGTLNNLALTSLLEASSSSIRFGELLTKPSGTSLTLTTHARLTPEAVSLQEGKLNFHTLELTVSGTIGLGNPPAVDITLDSNQVELADLQPLLPLLQAYGLSGNFETHMKIAGQLDADTLPQINGTISLQNGGATIAQLPQPVTDMQTSITFTGQGAKLTNTSARIGQSQFQLDAHLEQFNPLKLQYELNAPLLRMADLQSVDSPGDSEDALQNIHATGRAWMQGDELRHEGKLTCQQGSVAQIAYTDFQLDSSLANQIAKIDSFKVQAFQGTIQGTGQYAFGMDQPQFSVTSQVTALNLTQLFRAALPLSDQMVQGIASLDLSLSGRGQTWDDIKPTLQGQGKAEIADGAVLDLNIAEGVLSGLTRISGLSFAISPTVRDKYPAIFTSAHTEFDELESRFSLGDSKINLDSLRIAARDFMMQGTGWLDFDQHVDLKATISLSKTLSADIIKGTKEIKYIANEEDRLELPFTLRGIMPGVTPTPDVAYLGTLLQRAATNALQERLLDKFLPTKREDTQQQKASGVGQTGEASQEKKPSLQEQLIQKGLDSLFGR